MISIIVSFAARDIISRIMKMLAAREAIENEKNDKVNNLKKQISDLVYENNRYHFSLSYCTVCRGDRDNFFWTASLSYFWFSRSTKFSKILYQVLLGVYLCQRCIVELNGIK